MRVLLAYDGSTHSEAALASICARASYLPQGTRVTAVYVLPPVVPPLARPMSRSVMSAARADLARRILAPALRALNEAGLKVRALHPTGDVATRIARVAKSEKSTLIVMGSHGRSARAGLLFGSVSSGVLAGTETPVLLLRGERALPDTPLKVALAYDDSADSRAALDFVLAHLGRFDSRPRLHLAHVVDEVPIQVRTALVNLGSTEFTPDQVRAQRDEAFAQATDRAQRKLQKSGVRVVDHLLVGGNPGDALAAFAKREKIDLLVMGCRGRTRLRTAFSGSVTNRVAARSDVPLLLVRSA
jgi:nucleotide-binding universal stress UspA family protein